MTLSRKITLFTFTLLLFILPFIACTPQPDHCYQSVCFSHADQFSTAIIDTAVPADDPPTYHSLPPHLNFEFSGYPIQEHTFDTPYLMVIPAQEFSQLSPLAQEQIEFLKTTLTTQPTQPESLPTLPPWPAAQILQTQIEYLDFNDISGVRFLTQYVQNEWPITNSNIFYNFLGLTADQQTLLIGIFPVNHPDLLADGYDYMDTVDYQEFADNYLTYLADIETFLDQQSPETFTPSLTHLDQFITSITISD